LLIQPFVNYNMEDGWYLVSSPIITANWEGDSDDAWTVSVGGGFGKTFRIGNQPINAQLQGFYNVEHPQFGPEWIMRFQLQSLFPKYRIGVRPNSRRGPLYPIRSPASTTTHCANLQPGEGRIAQCLGRQRQPAESSSDQR
jgi:hypothetical protein